MSVNDSHFPFRLFFYTQNVTSSYCAPFAYLLSSLVLFCFVCFLK